MFIGDTVLVRQRKHNKFSTRYDPKPYRITKINGTMVTAHVQDIPSPGIFPFTKRFNHNLAKKSGKTVMTWEVT